MPGPPEHAVDVGEQALVLRRLVHGDERSAKLPGPCAVHGSGCFPAEPFLVSSVDRRAPENAVVAANRLPNGLRLEHFPLLPHLGLSRAVTGTEQIAHSSTVRAHDGEALAYRLAERGAGPIVGDEAVPPWHPPHVVHRRPRGQVLAVGLPYVAQDELADGLRRGSRRRADKAEPACHLGAGRRLGDHHRVEPGIALWQLCAVSRRDVLTRPVAATRRLEFVAREDRPRRVPQPNCWHRARGQSDRMGPLAVPVASHRAGAHREGIDLWHWCLEAALVEHCCSANPTGQEVEWRPASEGSLPRGRIESGDVQPELNRGMWRRVLKLDPDLRSIVEDRRASRARRVDRAEDHRSQLLLAGSRADSRPTASAADLDAPQGPVRSRADNREALGTTLCQRRHDLGRSVGQGQCAGRALHLHCGDREAGGRDQSDRYECCS